MLDVAISLRRSFAKSAIAGLVDGEPVDLSYRIEHDAKLAIVTADDEAGLEVLRHSTAHLQRRRSNCFIRKLR